MSDIVSPVSILPPGYSWVLLIVVLYCLELFWTSTFPVNFRKKHLSKKYLLEEFPEEHKLIKGGLVHGGFPDMGTGRLVSKLPFNLWWDFNSQQRVHYNFLETFPIVLSLTLISGIYFPLLTFICGILYIIGRYFYSVQYSRDGPGSRMFGLIMFDIALITLLLSSLVNVYLLGGGITGFVKFITCQ